MKKTIRLTESDLSKLIKRVINEQSDEYSQFMEDLELAQNIVEKIKIESEDLASNIDATIDEIDKSNLSENEKSELIDEFLNLSEYLHGIV